MHKGWHDSDLSSISQILLRSNLIVETELRNHAVVKRFEEDCQWFCAFTLHVTTPPLSLEIPGLGRSRHGRYLKHLYDISTMLLDSKNTGELPWHICCTEKAKQAKLDDVDIIMNLADAASTDLLVNVCVQQESDMVWKWEITGNDDPINLDIRHKGGFSSRSIVDVCASGICSKVGLGPHAKLYWDERRSRRTKERIIKASTKNIGLVSAITSEGIGLFDTLKKGCTEAYRGTTRSRHRYTIWHEARAMEKDAWS